MKKARLLAAALSALIAAGTLAGCSQGSSSSSAAASGSTSSGDKAVTISVTFRDDGTGANGTWYKWFTQTAEQLKKEKPNITLKVAPITASEGDYFSKIALQLKSGDNCPDLVTEDTFQLNSDVAAGYLTSLDDKVASWSDWSNFYDSLKKGSSASDGKVYGVPFNTDTRGLWYNKELFTKAGLSTDWQPKTWDDVLAAARTIKTKLPSVVPFWMNSGKATGEATSMQTYEMLLYGTGERLLDDNGKWIVKSQGIKDALTFIKTIYTEKLGPPLSKVLNGEAGNNEARIYFPQGKLAIGLDGSWIPSNWMKGGQAEWSGYETKMGLAAMPTEKGDNGGTITLAGGWCLAIPSKAKNPDAAWEAIKIAANKDNMQYVDIQGGSITARTDIASTSEYTSTPFNDISTNFLKTAQFRPQNDKYPSVSTCIQTMVESVVSGSSVDAAIAKYGQDVTRIVGADAVVSK